MTTRLEKLAAEILALPEEQQKYLLRVLSSNGTTPSVREPGVVYSETEGRSGMKSLLVRLPDELAREAQAAGLLRDRSLEELIRRALRDRDDASDAAPGNDARSDRLPVYEGKSGLAKGINPSSNRSMLDAAGDDLDDA